MLTTMNDNKKMNLNMRSN